MSLKQRLQSELRGQVKALSPTVNIDNEGVKEIAQAMLTSNAEMVGVFQQALAQQAQFMAQQQTLIKQLTDGIAALGQREANVTVEAPSVTVERPSSPLSISITKDGDGEYTGTVSPDYN